VGASGGYHLKSDQRAETLAGEPTSHTLLTVRDVARLLGMSERWVHERTRRREIPCYRFGTALRFHPEEIRAWMTKCHGRPPES